jgi:hypothetical protein
MTSHLNLLTTFFFSIVFSIVYLWWLIFSENHPGFKVSDDLLLLQFPCQNDLFPNVFTMITPSRHGAFFEQYHATQHLQPKAVFMSVATLQ